MCFHCVWGHHVSINQSSLLQNLQFDSFLNVFHFTASTSQRVDDKCHPVLCRSPFKSLSVSFCRCVGQIHAARLSLRFIICSSALIWTGGQHVEVFKGDQLFVVLWNVSSLCYEMFVRCLCFLVLCNIQYEYIVLYVSLLIFMSP